MDTDDLTPVQARIVGALLEKQLTTPDVYPLTLKALTAACNQSSNREPVVAYEERLVETSVLALKAKGLARIVHPGAGERSTRYRQVLDEAMQLSSAERALVCALLLRGAQTVAELRARTERLHGFGSADELEDALDGLARREPPLVARLDRRAGQKEQRWLQLLEAGAEERAALPVSTSLTPSAAVRAAGSDRVDALEARVEALEARVAALAEALGEP